MVGVAENLNMRITLTLEKKTATKVVRRRKRLSIERLLRDIQTTFPLRHGNIILTATVSYVTHSEKTVHLLKFFKNMVGAPKVTLAKKLVPNLNNFRSRNGICLHFKQI